MKITELTLDNREEVAKLLNEFDLIYTDLNQANIQLFEFSDSDETIGFGGLEIVGSKALLRSVVVKKEFQGKGFGKIISNWIEQRAKEQQISTLYLLTTTARDFFEHQGYQVVDREDFPEPIKQTKQFSGLCPLTAHCMTKTLN